MGRPFAGSSLRALRIGTRFDSMRISSLPPPLRIGTGTNQVSHTLRLLTGRFAPVPGPGMTENRRYGRWVSDLPSPALSGASTG